MRDHVVGRARGSTADSIAMETSPCSAMLRLWNANFLRLSRYQRVFLINCGYFCEKRNQLLVSPELLDIKLQVA